MPTRSFLKRIISLLLFVAASTSIYAQDKIPMDLQSIDNLFTFSAGALVSIESALLLIGMNLPQPSTWSSPLNIVFAVSDIIIGGYLVYLSLSGASYEANPLYYIGIGILVLTHGFRAVGYFIPESNPFTANLPLFLVNIARLLFLGSSFGISLRLYF